MSNKSILFLKKSIKWFLLSVLIGVIAGIVGGVFSKLIEYATELRADRKVLHFLLPLGGIITVAIFKLLKVNTQSTKNVFSAVKGEGAVSPLLAPAIFLGTVISHLFGASVGREGAALQLGGSISALFAKIFNLSPKETQVLTVCGMGAFFSAIFGTPIGAFIFALEVVFVPKLIIYAFIPSLLSCITAKLTSFILGVKGEHFPLSFIPDFSFNLLIKIIIIAVLTAFISYLFCKFLNISHKYFEKIFKNEYIRIVSGSIILLILILFVQSFDYCGGGINIIENIFEHSEYQNNAFIFKILLTVIAVSAGFKGGEIIPSIFIGASFGAFISGLLNFNIPFGAAIGVAAMFSGVTKCPIATIFLCAELFGVKGIILFSISSALGFLLSGKVSLYSSGKKASSS